MKEFNVLNHLNSNADIADYILALIDEFKDDDSIKEELQNFIGELLSSKKEFNK